MYTLAVIIFCGIEYKAYYNKGNFMWRGMIIDIARIWIVVPGFIIGCTAEALIEVSKYLWKFTRWVVVKLKED